jgi:ADP-heptose:LPS heptosyltransferase
MVIDLKPSIAAGSRPHVLVLRFHSLGDCVLTTGVTRALAATARVTVATEERFRPLFSALPWIERVLVREDLDSGRRRAAGAGVTSPTVVFDRVIDLQGTPGTRRLGRALGREASTVRTRSAARRWQVLWGDRFPRPPVPHAVERYAEAAGIAVADAMTTCRPEVRVSVEEEAAARLLAPEVFASPPGTAVAIVTGASRRTKEYPSERLAQVAGLVRAAGLATWWIEPPGRGDSSAGHSRMAPPCSPHSAGLDHERLDDGRDRAPDAAVPVLRLPLGPLKAVLARVRAVAVSDSGPMHLAAALGRPVLGIFGSTITGFGFAPIGPKTRVLEAMDVACRPCGVHGRDHCWLGHWRCLRDLEPARVVEELLKLARQSGSAQGDG